MAILRHDTVMRNADGQTMSTMVTTANIGTYGVAANSTYYIGTTQNVFNRASGAQTLTGVSIDGNAANITAYTINQNLGTANAPSFAGATLSSTLAINGGDGLRAFRAGAATVTSHIYWANVANTVAYNWQLDENNNAAMWGYTSAWGKLLTVTSAGVFTASGDFRAPIFYDSNDTTYYIDPASTSRVVALWVRGSSETIGNIYVGGTSAGNRLNISYDQIWTPTAHLYLQYSGAGNIDMNYGGGVAFSRTSLRAPIFYDFDNTAYYLDPANTGTSLLVAGKVGIGTTSPNTPLDVVGNSSANALQIRNRSDNDYGFIIFNNYAGSEISIAQIGAYRTGVNQGSLLIYTGTTEKVRINNDGNVGIGTTSPVAKLDVNGTSNFAANVYHSIGGQKFFAGSGGTYAYIYTGTTALNFINGNDTSTLMTLLNGGNVGIGTTSPANKLHVVGSAYSDTDFRAPIFYDSNDTGYFLNPNSTSNLNNLRAATISAANHGLTCVYYGGGSTPTNGYLITTNIDYSTFNMPTVIIEGYAYGNGVPIHLEIVWYAYNNSWTNLAYTNLGNWNPGTVSIGTNASGKVCLHLSSLIYYGRFNVRCIYDGGNAPLEGWTVTDATTSALTRVTTISKVELATSITGNAATVTNGLYTSSTLTAGNLSGTIPSGVLGNSTHFIGTTSIALNRGSASQTLTGVSIDGNAATATNGLTTSNYVSYSAFSGSVTSGANITATGYVYASTYLQTGGNLIYPSTYGVTQRLEVSNAANNAWIDGLTIAPGGIVTAYGDSRAPIFYDSNNTAYYINPAGNSIVNSLTFDSNITIYKHNDRNLLIQGGGGTDAGLLGRGSSGQFAFQLYGSGGGDYGFLDGAWASWDIRKTVDGNLYLNGNDTYYLNPASTSRLNIVHSNYYIGEITDSGNGDSNAPFRFESDYSGWSMIFAGTPGSANGWGTFWAGNDNPAYYYFGTSNPNEYVFVGAGSVKASIDLDNGQSYFATSLRSPIFYDSDNTAYYIDGASGSKLKYLQIDGDWGSSPFGSGHESFTIRSTYASMVQRQTNGALAYWLHHIPSDGSYMLYGGRGATDGSSWDWALRAYPNQDGSYVEFNTSARAQIFYDRNDTTYYVDAASTSRLNTLNVVGAVTAARGVFSDSSGSGSAIIEAYNTVATNGTTAIFRQTTAGGNGNQDIGLLVDIQGAADTDRIANFRYYNGSTYTSRMAIMRGGNVGIGTTSPSGKLHVYNSAAADTYLESGTSGTTGKLIFKTSDNADLNKYIMQESFYMILNGHANEGFKFRDSNSNVLLSIFGAQNAYASRVGIGTITPAQKLHVSGIGYSDTDFRAPIFYDSNNTAYYLDPASTSVMNQINLAGILRRTASAAGYLEGNYPTGVDSNSSSAIYTIGGAYQPAATNLGNMYGCGYTVGNGTANPGLGASGWGFYVASGGTSRIFLDSDVGYGIASNSWRAPIFYDSNDTTYYLNPADVSYLYEPRMAYRTLIGAQSYDATLFETPVTTRPGVVVRGSYPHIEMVAAGIDNSTHGATLRFAGYDTGGATTGNFKHWVIGCPATNLTGLYFGYSPNQTNPHYGIGRGWSSGNDVSIFWILNDREVYAENGVRATIFYDRNNTSYYLDPASTSILDATRHNSIVAGSTSGMSSAGAIAVYSAGSPYISFHDGTTARTAYFQELSGRFYFGEVTYTESEGSFRAPLFYDSNDTAYYVDPNGTSSLYNLSLVGAKNTYLIINPGNGYEAMVRYIGGSGSGWYVGKRMSSQLVGTADFHFFSEAAGATIGGIDTSGNIFSSGSVRSPIFYDSNDTAFYGDFASTSVLNRLNYQQLRRNFASTVYTGTAGSRTVKTFSGVLVGGSAIGGNSAYTVIETTIPQGAYQMGGFTINWFENYSSTNAKTTIEIAGYWNPVSNGGFIGFEYTTSNPNVQPTIRVGANASGNTVFILDHFSSNYTVIIARDLWLGYDATDGEWGTGWTMVNTTTIAAYSNIVSAVLRVGPTLTGTGASGTWSINVTGNAGGSSASCTGNSATTTLATKATRANGDFYIDDNYGNTVVGNYNAARYQGVFAMGNSYKLPADGTTTGSLYGIAWSHPNAGGAAGNLSDHGALILLNGTYAAAISSSIRCTADMRTPIYYDSNDTAYYVNPNSETRLYKASIYAGNEASNTGANGSTEGLILRGNYNSNTWAKKFHNYDNGSGIQLYLAETVGAGAWSTLQGWGTGLGYTSRVFGSFAADSALYSPIFYDTGNTAYYCDPAGSSNFSIVTAADFYAAGWFRNNTNGHGIYNQATAQHFYSDDVSYWNVASSSSAQGIRLRTGGHAGTVRGYFYADTANDVGLLNNAGNWRVRVVGGDYTLIDGSSIRAQIFYDSNDTGYYTDPAGTSILNVVRANSYVQKSASQSLSGTVGCTIDVAAAGIHVLTLAASTTISSFTYNYRAPNPSVNTIMLVIKYGGTASITWTNVLWANGVTPTITGVSSYADVYMLTSYQGTTGVWIGTVVAQGLVSTSL